MKEKAKCFGRCFASWWDNVPFETHKFKCTYLEPLKCCCAADLEDKLCFMARFLSGCDLWSFDKCRWSILFGIDDDDEPPELCRDDCCCDDDCVRTDGIFGIPLLLLLLPTFAPALPLFRDGIGPFEVLFCGGLCEAFGGNIRSDGRLRSPRSFLCCLLELVADGPPPPAAKAAALIASAACDDDDPCCINFWCVDDDEEEEDLWSPGMLFWCNCKIIHEIKWWNRRHINGVRR